MTTLALFNNKGGVGATTLVYHLAHMFQRLSVRVLAVDLDPQSSLTAAFLTEEELAILWDEPDSPAWPDEGQTRLTDDRVDSDAGTVAGSVLPIMEGLGDIQHFHPVSVTDGLYLVPGDLGLSTFEGRLSEAWPRSATGKDQAAIRTTTAFHRIVRRAAETTSADLVLVDVGPNLSAINRAALLSVDAVLVPLAADLFSLRGLRDLGPTLREWSGVWRQAIRPQVPAGVDSPPGTMEPIGYVIMQPIMRLDRPIGAYRRWLERIPRDFETAVRGNPDPGPPAQSHEIATLRNYQSLLQLARDARKPMFDLRTADGAIGSTQTFVQRCYAEFRNLAERIADHLPDERVRDVLKHAKQR